MHGSSPSDEIKTMLPVTAKEDLGNAVLAVNTAAQSVLHTEQC